MTIRLGEDLILGLGKRSYLYRGLIHSQDEGLPLSLSNGRLGQARCCHGTLEISNGDGLGWFRGSGMGSFLQIRGSCRYFFCQILQMS